MTVARLLLTVLAAAGLASCGPSGGTSGQESFSVHVRKQPDGLVYEQGATTPYTGQVVTFTKAGLRQSMENYLHGRPEGAWERYWPDGTLKREQKFLAGHQILQRQWYEDGALKEEIEMKDGVRFGKLRLWWPDGRLRRSSLVGSDAKLHGNALEYAQDGTLLTDAIFHHGQYVSGLLRKDNIANAASPLAE